jgi:dTDP-4-dehydrorhamnose 3,5-epimerase
MKATRMAIPEVVLLEPEVFGDERGFFLESYNQGKFEHAIGRTARFVQDNHSRSSRDVLRGLHYQVRRPQAKLVRAATGAIFDVAVDLRRSSPTFGRWVGEVLSDENRKQMWIPEGFAHGFAVLTPFADCLYKATGYRAAAHERCIAWNDPQLAVVWPCREPLLSTRDASGIPLSLAEVFA